MSEGIDFVHSQQAGIDRQMVERCARAGDPTAFRQIVDVDRPFVAERLAISMRNQVLPDFGYEASQ